MKSPSCPYCKKTIYYSLNDEITCNESDHDFWYNYSNKSWNINIKAYNVSICETELSLWADFDLVTIMSFEKIEPEEGIKILQRYMKLKGFL